MRLSTKDSLKDASPELAKQWHPTRNGTLTPDKVTPATYKEVWWKCKNGHEWEAIISKRKNADCPYCSGRRVTKLSKEYNLEALHPDIASQWHPTKNGTLTPDKVTPGSGKKVWWKCEKGHEWKAQIAMRKYTGCSRCSGRKVAKLSKEYNLEAVHPDIASQWHPTKNGTLTPDKVTPGSGKKVWWKCKKGHEWKAQIAMRKYGGCYRCSNRKVTKLSKECNLKALHPDIASQWHPTKNGTLTPDKVTPDSSKRVWWRCEKDHEWKTMVITRKKSTGCPYCRRYRASKDYNLQVINPQLAKQWHPTKNGDLTPDKLTPGSGKKVWWKCEKGHEWRARILHRNRGAGCPYCAGYYASEDYNLQVINPHLAKQWHPTKNGDLTPDKVTPGSGRRVWWKCEKGHEWMAVIAVRNNSKSCPYCTGFHASQDYNLQVVNPQLAEQWHPARNGDLTPDNVTPYSNKRAWWICEKGHEYDSTISNRNSGRGCPYCAGRRVLRRRPPLEKKNKE